MDNDRLVKILQATPEKLRAIDRILNDEFPAIPATQSQGPLLRTMTDSANYFGVSRTTLWRMIQAGHLKRVEIMAGTFRFRHHDLLALAEKGVEGAT